MAVGESVLRWSWFIRRLEDGAKKEDICVMLVRKADGSRQQD